MKKLFLLFGAIFAALAGMLFAPRSGRETRNKISAEIKKGGNGLNLMKEDAQRIGKDIAATVKEIGQNAEVKKIVQRGRKKVKNIYQKGKKEVREVLEEGKKIMEAELEKGKKTFDKITDHAYSFGVKESQKLKGAIKKKLPALKKRFKSGGKRKK